MRVDDAGLVRAPRWLVHRRVTEVDHWSLWWPGMRVLDHVPGDGLGARETLHVELHVSRPWRPGARLRLALALHGERPDLGVHLLVTGDLSARAELWLEDALGGTLVHHVADVDDRSARHGPTWRVAVRQALWALDARLAAEVRTAVGVLDAPARPAGSTRPPTA